MTYTSCWSSCYLMSFSVITHSIWSTFYSNCCTIIKIRYRDWSHLFICSKCLIRIINCKIGCYRCDFNINFFFNSIISIITQSCIIVRHSRTNRNPMNIPCPINFSRRSCNRSCMSRIIIRIRQPFRQIICSYIKQ